MSEFISNLLFENVNNYYTESMTITNEKCDEFTQYALSILLVNVRSVRDLSRFDDLRIQLALMRRRPDVIVVTESWIERSVIGLYDLVGYALISYCRDDRGGGGVVVYVNDEISFTNPIARAVHGIENVQFSLELAKDNVIIIDAYYRPPEVPFSRLTEVLSANLAQHPGHKRIVLGDFNVNLLGYSSMSNQYVDLVESLGFVVVNNEVTRPVSGTLLDHVLKNFQCESVHMTFDFGIRTDHNSILSLFNVAKDVSAECECVKRYTNWRAYEIQLSQEVANIQDDDPNVMCNALVNAILDSVSSNTTERTFRLKRNGCEWMTSELQSLIRRKENLKRATLRYPLSIIYQTRYNDVCEELTDLKRRTKSQYFDSKLGNNTSSKQKWNNLNQILGRSRKSGPEKVKLTDGRTLRTPLEISDRFNEYFSTIASNISPPELVNNNINRFGTLDRHPNSFFLEPVTVDEVECAILSLSEGKAPGLDGVSVGAMKRGVQAIVPVLTNLINKCFSTGVFPDALKLARVTPVFKAGDRELVSNYRPISILSVLNKIFENCIYVRLIKFLNACNYFHSTQYGFREKSSTSGACLELLEDVYKAIDDRKYVCATFFDCSKAFDLVPHNILLDKLELAGIRGLPLELFRSYLSDRWQAVSIQGHNSSMRRMEMGVAQGSKLGPLLYLMYTNDLGRLPIKGKLMLYADDVAILYRSNSPAALLDDIRHDMLSISLYYRTNRLVLNLDKSKVMFFGRRSNRDVSEDIVINGTIIERVASYKYLGLVLDSNLNFKSHVEHVARRLTSIVGTMYRVKDFVPRHILITLFFSLFHSNMSYLLEVYGTASKTILKRIETLQRRALKMIFNLPNQYPTSELYQRVRGLNIVPVKVHYYVTMGSFAHKVINRSTHCNIVISEDNPLRRGRHTRRYKLDKVRSEMGKRRFSYEAKLLGNEIDDTYSPSISICRLKKRIRSFLTDDESKFVLMLDCDRFC